MSGKDIDQYIAENMNFAMSRLEYEEGEPTEIVEIQGVFNFGSFPFIDEEVIAEIVRNAFSNMKFQAGGPSKSPHAVDAYQYASFQNDENPTPLHVHFQQKQSNDSEFDWWEGLPPSLSQRIKAWWGRLISNFSKRNSLWTTTKSK